MRVFSSALVAALVVAAGPSSASLIGDSVGATITGGTLPLSPATATVVDPGVEFQGSFGGFGNPLSLDFSGTSATLKWLEDFPFIFSTDFLTLTDLDFAGAPGGLTGVTVTASGSGLDNSDITFTADSVTVDLRNWDVSEFGSAVFTFSTATGAPVPEPGSFALVGAALIALRCVGARKNSNRQG